MSEVESTPLLGWPTTQSRAETSGDGVVSRKLKRVSVHVAAVLEVLVFAASLVLIAVLSVRLFQHTHLSSNCQNGTSFTKLQTRSNSYSLLANLSQPTCSQPFVQLSLLSGKDSSIQVRQDSCNKLAIQQFTLDDDFRDDISLVSSSYPIFDDNFPVSQSPQRNNFINGSILVTFTNITSNLPSATIEVYFFTDNKEYYKFADAGANWKAYTKNAECHSLPISDGGGDYEVSLNVSKPTFVFVGIASSQHIHISHLHLNATGYDILDFGTSTSACNFTDDDNNCFFHLLNNTQENERICLVAFKEGTAESYRYSTIAVTLPTPAKRDGKGPLYVLGFCSLATFILALVLIMVSVFVCYRRRQSGQSTVSDDGDTVRDIPQTVQNRTIQATLATSEDTTDGTLVVASPTNPSRVAGRVIPTELSPTVNTPIQETKTSPLPTPSPTDDGQRLPVQENATQISSTVENYSREGDTFPPGFSETAPEQ